MWRFAGILGLGIIVAGCQTAPATSARSTSSTLTALTTEQSRIRLDEETFIVHIDVGPEHDPDLPAHLESLLRENEIAGVCQKGPHGYYVEVPVYERRRARELLVQDGKTRRYVVRSTPVIEVTVEN